MGTWGTTAFEDDTAMEFYDDFCLSEQSITDLEDALDLVLNRQYDMNELLIEGFTEPMQALVSAEIIAASMGKPVATFPDDSYHAELETPEVNLSNLKFQVKPDTIRKAKEVLTKLLETNDIHLTELWRESESFEKWKTYIHDLMERLN